MKMTLFQGKFREVVYFPYQKKLVTTWFGKISEEAYADHLDYLVKLIDSYEIKHLVFDTENAKSHFFKPSLRFVQNVLAKAVQNGAAKLTMIQKSLGNREQVEDIYRVAMSIHNMDLQVSVIEPSSFPAQADIPSFKSHGKSPAMFSASNLQRDYSPIFG